MEWPYWLQRLLGVGRRSRRKPSRRLYQESELQLYVTQLEERRVLTVSSAAAVAQTTLASCLNISGPSSGQDTAALAEHQPPDSQTLLASTGGQTVAPAATLCANSVSSARMPGMATSAPSNQREPTTGISAGLAGSSVTGTEPQGALTSVSNLTLAADAGRTQVGRDASLNLVITVASGSEAPQTLTLQSDTERGLFVISGAAPIRTDLAGAVGDGSRSVIVPFQAVSGNRVIVNAWEGHTTFVLDVSAGAFLKQVEYHGGPGGNDVLGLTGGFVGSLRYSFQSPSQGQIDWGSGGTHTTLQFSGVSAFVDDLQAGDRGFQFSAEPATITLSDDARSGDQHSWLASSLGTSIVFTDPTSSLTINAGANSDRGGDTFHLLGLDATFNADLAILGNAADTVTIGGQIDLGAGSLTLRGGRVDINQTVTTQGANVAVRGSESITVAASGAILDPRGTIVIDAPTLVHDGLLSATGGGQITLDAGRGGTLLSSGVIDVAGHEPGQVGGTVQLLGDQVGLIGSARIDASGVSGGGTVLVGGDYQGENPQVLNASRTYISRDSRIVADASLSGDGGRVIAWSDEVIQFYGTISANGGALDGDGGFVETSGRAYLEVLGASVQARSNHGQAGQWLLDPRDVNIQSAASAHGAFDAGSPDVFATDSTTPASDPAIASVDAIQAALNAGTNVTITTGPGSGNATQQGDITVMDPIAKIAGAAATLTLQADHSIIVNNTISGSDGHPLSVILQAGAAGSISVNKPIATFGGSFAATGLGLTQSLGANISTGVGAITLIANSLTLGGGPNSVSGSTTLLLEPLADTVSIDVGSPAGGTGTLSISDADLAALAEGFSGITIGRSTGQHVIVVGSASFQDAVTIQTPVGGSIAVIGQLDTLAGANDNQLASITLAGTGNTTTLSADVVTSGAPIDIQDNLVVADGKRVSLNTASGAPAGAAVTLQGSLDGDSATVAAETLEIDAGTGGTVTIDSQTGATGSTTPLNLTIVNSNSTTFSRAASLLSTAFNDTTGTIAFQGATAITTLTTAGKSYSLSFTGARTDVTNPVTFSNTGGVTLGDGADEFLFDGGFVSTSSTTTLNGNVRTSADAMQLGAVSLAGNSLLDTTNNGSNPAGNDITLGAVTGGGHNLTVDAPSTTFGVVVTDRVSGLNQLAVTGATRLNTDTVSGTTLTFSGSLTLGVNAALTHSGANSLSISGGTLDTNGHTLTDNAVSSSTIGVIDNVIVGSGSLSKTGNGLLTLTGANTYSGGTTVDGGMLWVNNSSGSGTGAGAVTVQNAGVLGGSGTVSGSVTVQGTAAVSPGPSSSGTGILRTGNVTWGSSARFQVQLNGSSAGGGYDQLQVAGAVDLGGAALDATRLTTFVPPLGLSLVLIDNEGNAPIAGTFAGLAENAVVVIGGVTFTISYQGGTGNDVVLTEAPPTTVFVDDSWAGTTAGGSPATSSPVGLAFGYNAFATIQGGIDQVASGGTVTIYGGVYVDAVEIHKSLTPIQIATNPNVGGETTVEVRGAVTLGANTTFQEGGTTNLTLGGTVNGVTGTEALTVNGSNVLKFGGVVGGLVPLASLSTDLSGQTVIQTAAITTRGDQVYGDNVMLAADVTLDARTGNVRFAGTVDGSHGLSVHAAGTTTFALAVGSDTPLASLYTLGATEVNGGAVTTHGDQSYGQDLILGANTALTASAGDLTVVGTSNGSFALTLSAMGAVQLLGTVGGNAPLAGLTIHDAASASLAAVTTQAGGIAVATTGSGTTLQGDLQTTGLISLTGNVSLGAPGSVTFQHAGNLLIRGAFLDTHGRTLIDDSSLAGTTGTISSSILGSGGLLKTGPGQLTLTGNSTYTQGTVVDEGTLLVNNLSGSGTGFGNVTVNHASLLGGTGAMAGSLEVKDTATVSPGLLAASTAAPSSGTVTLGPSTTFQVQLNGSLAGSGYDQLNVTGAVTLSGTTLAVTKLTSFIPPNGGSLVLINNDGSDPVIGTFAGLAEGATVTLGGVPLTISYQGGTGNDVVLTALPPTAVYVDDSWAATTLGTTPLASAPASLIFGYNAFAAIQGGIDQVTAGGTLTLYGGTYAGAVDMNKALTPIQILTNPNLALEGTVDITGPVTLSVNATFQEIGTANLALAGTVDGQTGNETLAVQGGNLLTLAGAVGGSVPLASVTTDPSGSTQLGGGLVRTVGAQTYSGPVTLAASTTLTTTAGGNILLAGTVDGAQTLVLNTSGLTSFNAQVGGSTALTSVTTDAAGNTQINGGLIRTTGAQTYRDAVTLGRDTTLAATAGGSVNLAGTVEGGQALAVNTSGVTTFGGTVGGATALTSVNTDAGGSTRISGGLVRTSGVQTYRDAVLLGADTTLASTAGGFIDLASTVDGGQNLTLGTSGSTTFGGAVGGSTALTSVAIAAGASTQIKGGLIRTTGDQTYQARVALGADTALTSTAGGNVDLTGAVDGGQALVVNTSGITTLGGPVGGTTALTGVTTDAGGSTQINGGLVLTSGGQAYHDAVTLNADTALTSTNGGQIRLAGTVDGARTLAVNTSGLTTFGGSVGGSAALASVTTDAGGSTQLDGASIQTTGSQTYLDDARLGAAVTLTSTGGGNIAWAGTLDGGGSLAVNTSGFTTFGGTVGGTTALASVTTDAAGSTQINGGMVRTSGGQTYDGAVTLNADATLTSTLGGNITVAGPLDGGQALLVNTSGTTTFGGPVGGATALTSVTTDAGGGTQLDGGLIQTTGGQTYHDAVRLGADLILNSTLGGELDLGNAVDGAQALTVNTSGITRFGGPVGGATALASVTTDAAGSTQFQGGLVHTTGDQLYRDPVALAASTALATGAGNAVFSGPVDGAYSLSVQSLGTVVFSTAVGSATPLAGLAVTQANMAWLPAIQTRAGGIQVAATAINLQGDLRTGGAANAGSVTLTGAVSLASDVTLDTVGTGADGSITVTGTIDGLQSLTLIAGGGSVSLRGAVGGTTPLSRFTVPDAASASLPAVTTSLGDIRVKTTGSGAVLHGDLNSAAAVSLVGNVALGGPISVQLTQTGSEALVISGGTLHTGGGTLVDNAATVATTGTISSPITGPGGLTKTGPGTLTMTAASTYTGATTVAGGRLLINGSTAAASALTVQNGAMLGGVGTIPGSLTVQAGGEIDPGAGASTGILTVGSVSFEPGSRLTIQINGKDPGPAGYDQLLVSHTAALVGTGPVLNAILNFNPNITESRFVIIEVQGGPVSGGFQGLPPNAQYLLTGQPYQVFYNQVNPASIPPTSGHNVVLQSLGFLSVYQPIETVTVRSSGVAGGLQYELPPPSRTATSMPGRPLETMAAGNEVVKEAERQVEVRIVTPTDDRGGVKETTVLKLPVSVLKDLSQLIAALPDDRYRIYLVIQGGERQLAEARLVRDLAVRHGKPWERNVAAPPADLSSPAARTAREPPGVASPGRPTPPPDAPATETPLKAASPRGTGPTGEAGTRGAAWLPAGLAVGSTAALCPTRVDEAIVRCSRRLLTKAARLVRRGRLPPQERLRDAEASWEK